jgi:hypothetical protein
MQRIANDERRRRLAVRHHVAPACRATDLEWLASDVVGIHATDPASVYLGLLARAHAVTHADIAETLYERRTLLRILGMRRTMFVTTAPIAGVISSAVSRKIAARERSRLIGWLEADGVGNGDAEAWLAAVEAETMTALTELGEATASELTKRVPGLRIQIHFGGNRKWAGKVGVSTRVLFLLAAEARIIRGRPRGTWLSSMYAWAPMDRWVPGGLRAATEAGAQAELVRLWLRSFGPGTERDVAWWTGMTLGDTRRALAAASVVPVDLDDGVGLTLPADLEPTPDPGPWVALLPALDTTTMGWADRSWYLGEHGRQLFDTNGNAGPAIWADGRVVGGWSHARDGEIRYRLLADVGAEAREAIDQEAHRISKWLGAARVIPRFRTPIEREL